MGAVNLVVIVESSIIAVAAALGMFCTPITVTNSKTVELMTQASSFFFSFIASRFVGSPAKCTSSGKTIETTCSLMDLVCTVMGSPSFAPHIAARYPYVNWWKQVGVVFVVLLPRSISGMSLPSYTS